jgi:hypothetical protein
MGGDDHRMAAHRPAADRIRPSTRRATCQRSPMTRALPCTVCLACVLITGCRANDSGIPNLISDANAAPPPTTELDPSGGRDIGLSFEAYMSPHQEPAEEQDTPSGTPEMFRSTTASIDRNARDAAGHRGHGKLRFSKDLSRAFVDVQIEGIAVNEINMFHIHCGKPGILGPIIVDFSQVTDVQKSFASGVFSVEIKNEHIVATAEHGHGIVAAFTAGCVIPSPSLSGAKPSKVSTVAGLAQIALERELYFNLHTTGQTFYGDVRGQLHPEG